LKKREEQKEPPRDPEGRSARAKQKEGARGAAGTCGEIRTILGWENGVEEAGGVGTAEKTERGAKKKRKFALTGN